MKKTAKTAAIESIEDLHAFTDDLARLDVELRRLEAERDKEMQAVRDRHDGRIEMIKKTMKATLGVVETYCLAHRSTLFGKAKSAGSALARFGFREGNPTLCLLNRKWTWATVLAALIGAGRTAYVRTVEEVDKDALKASKLTDAELAEIGVRIDQTERFFVEPKTDDGKRLSTEPATADA